MRKKFLAALLCTSVVLTSMSPVMAAETADTDMQNETAAALNEQQVSVEEQDETIHRTVSNGWEQVMNEVEPDTYYLLRYEENQLQEKWTWSNGMFVDRENGDGSAKTETPSGYFVIGAESDGKENSYYLKDGVPQSGWKKVDGKWYLFGTVSATPALGEGKRIAPETKAGFQEIEGKKYYLDDAGVPAKNTTITISGTSYDFNAEGVLVKSYPEVITGKWKANGIGRWYEYKDGSYPRNKWEEIDGTWYLFDAKGYVRTGWAYVGSAWYYLKPGTGAMQTGWVLDGGTWYYCNKSGAMQTGWVEVKGTWYYCKGNGAMQTGWILDRGTWYYCNGSGAMLTEWVLVGGTWYFCNSSGAMQTGWILHNGTWYYCDGSGAMATNRWIGNYYVYGNGAMATDAWIGSYYVDGSGKWVPNKGVTTPGFWKQNAKGWYFQYPAGNYAYNAWVLLDGEWYYLNNEGYMVTGWNYIDGLKYYFESNGKLCQDMRGRVGGPYAIRVNRAKCIITIFARDPQTGDYNVPVKAFICSVGCPWSPTVTGTFYTQAKYSYKQLNGPTWGKWCTRIVGGYLFHSMPSPVSSPYTIVPEKYNLLGQPASGGCVRMTVGDAKWIYDNCALGTRVTISDHEATPFDKPYVPKISSAVHHDPAGDNY
ncbi:MAG: L,D-transpeptidase family protein [Lachnospiraceae bacterium]|jgi:glucan-binding YG repeat protein